MSPVFVRPAAAICSLLCCLALSACPEGRGGDDDDDDDASTGAPEVSFLAPAEGSALYSNRAVDVQVLVFDVEDGPSGLEVSLSVEGGEELATGLTPEADGVVRFEADLDAGEQTLVAEAVDSDGRRGRATLALTVGPPNTAPTCSLDFPSQFDVLPALTPVVLRGTASDAQSTSGLTWTIRSTLQGPVAGGPVPEDGAIRAEVDDLLTGGHTLTLTVEDDAGADCEDTVPVNVSNPPRLSVEAPSDGGVINEGEELVLVARATDIETDSAALSMGWSSDVDGTLALGAPEPGGRWQVAASDLSLGAHVLTVTATDEEGLATKQELAVTVNGLPSAPEVAILPALPGTADPLQLSIVTPSADPEGQEITYLTTWRRGGLIQSAWTDLDTVPSSATSKAQTWTVTVRGTDGFGESEAATATVTVRNTPPTTNPPTVLPTVLTATTNATCLASGSLDLDGDPVTVGFTWTVNGSNPGVNSGTLPATYYTRDDVVQCIATPSDGASLGSPVGSAPILVQNSAPGAPLPAIEPAYPLPGDALECSVEVESTDPDGDAVTYTYAWLQDGSSTAYATDVVPASVTADGETWTCEVTPNDGVANGTVGDVSVLVEACGDDDGDGYTDALCGGNDCDDGEIGINPGAAEACNDGIDDDCDGFVDAGCPALSLDVSTHDSYYSGSVARGFWFVAPTDFTITQVMALGSTTLQNVQIVRFDGGPPAAWPASETNYTSLLHLSSQPEGQLLPVSVEVLAGQVIGVVGATGAATLETSMAAGGDYAGTIDGVGVTLTRLVSIGNIAQAPALAFASQPGTEIGRIEVEYVPF